MSTVSEQSSKRRDGLRALLPIGDTLDDGVWRQRHHLLVGLLIAHIPALLVLGLWWHISLAHAALEVAPAAVCAVLALRLPGRRLRAVLCTVGLVWCSVTLVDFSGGAIEAYFHFFVVIAFIALYQDWVAFSWAVLFTVGSHGVNALFGARIETHPASVHSPWAAALIHGFAVVCECVALVLLWRGSESEQRRAASLATDLTSAELVRTQLLAEQRATTGSLLTNLARRNQALLHRQLAKIDELEAREENAEALAELFALDHLATRMRRNAESLLVLSGEELPRRWSRPVPVGDVLRGAVAEIEDFGRVDVSLDGDADLSGRAVVDVVHLVAELIENATVFSPPATRVTVHGAPAEDGYQITVTDYGVGFASTDLATQTAWLRGEHADDLGLSAQLGFRVVARLAQRFDIRVDLASEPDHGTVVTVTLPAALFVVDDDATEAPPLEVVATEAAPVEVAAAEAAPLEEAASEALPVQVVSVPVEPWVSEDGFAFPAVASVEPLPSRRPLASLPDFEPPVFESPAAASLAEPPLALVGPTLEVDVPQEPPYEPWPAELAAPDETVLPETVLPESVLPESVVPAPTFERARYEPVRYEPVFDEPVFDEPLPDEPVFEEETSSPQVAAAPEPAPERKVSPRAPTLGVPRQYVPAGWTVDEPSWEDALPPSPVAPRPPAALPPPVALPPAHAVPAAFAVTPALAPAEPTGPVEGGWPVDVPVFATTPAGATSPPAQVETPVPALTSAGLVRRVPLANLAPQMTGVPVAPVLPADSVAMPAPERARSLLSTYRDGLTLGRAEPPVPASDPADPGSTNPGATP